MVQSGNQNWKVNSSGYFYVHKIKEPSSECFLCLFSWVCFFLFYCVFFFLLDIPVCLLFLFSVIYFCNYRKNKGHFLNKCSRLFKKYSGLFWPSVHLLKWRTLTWYGYDKQFMVFLLPVPTLSHSGNISIDYWLTGIRTEECWMVPTQTVVLNMYVALSEHHPSF